MTQTSARLSPWAEPAACASVKEALGIGRKILEAAGAPSPFVDAGELLARVLGRRRLDLLLDPARSLTRSERSAFRELLARRALREPLQYIVGSVQFREVEVKTDARALIPRQETEALLDHLQVWPSTKRRFRKALDVGTGSGALVLSLRAEEIAAGALATDVSRGALALARENARRLGLSRVSFRRGPGLDPVPNECFDLVVCNLPYIPSREIEGLESEVREWEPRIALEGGKSGLAVIFSVLDALPSALAPGGRAGFEIGEGQSDAVMARLAQRAPRLRARVFRDLAGRRRYVLIHKEDSRKGPE